MSVVSMLPVVESVEPFTAEERVLAQSLIPKCFRYAGKDVTVASLVEQAVALESQAVNVSGRVRQELLVSAGHLRFAAYLAGII